MFPGRRAIACIEGIGKLPLVNRREHTPLSATSAWVRAAAGDVVFCSSFTQIASVNSE